ncbi:MAG: pseudouridine synthase [Candidatus Gracilibacteria bacterium]
MSRESLKIRLNKFLSQSGLCSRRKADELIKKGEVEINNEKVTTLGTQIDPFIDKVTLKGKPVELNQNFLYVALNKPQGYITTLKDEFDRKTVMDLLPEDLRDKGLKPIGRLDKNTEGLLLLTNDNDLINLLTHPRYEKEKEYKATIQGNFSSKDKAAFERGLLLPEETTPTLPCKIRLTEAKAGKNTFIITIKEGRKRQIRNMFKLLGYTVIYLQRIRFGNLTLGIPPLQNLQIGQIKLIDKKCLQVGSAFTSHPRFSRFSQ